jgi:hypothetical protein
MTEFPGSFPYQGFFFVNGIRPFQERVFNKIRLPEEIKVFGPVHEEGNDIVLRFPVKNTVVFKRRIPQDSKPMGTLAAPVHKSPSIPSQSKPFIIRGDKAEAGRGPPGKPPFWSLFTKGNHTGKIHG